MTVPHAHWYRVQLGDGHSILACTKLVSGGSMEPFGVKETGPIGVGNQVLVAYAANGRKAFGYILGVLPRSLEYQQLLFMDLFQPGGNSGAFADEAYTGMLTGNAYAGGVRNFGDGRAVDSGAGGEYGWQAPGGPRMRLDDWQAVLAASDSCGLWANVWDENLRLTSRNFQVWTSGSELTVRDDEGEWVAEAGETPYPWESYGLYDRIAFPHNQTGVEDVEQFNNYGLAKIDDGAKKIDPFWRLRTYRGYVGQGIHAIVAAPPIGASGIRKTDDDQKDVGLMELHADMTGRVTLRAARGVGIYKDVSILVPRRKFPVEDRKNGDNFENYRAAGVYGGGPEHKIQMPKDAEDEHPAWKIAAAQMDLWSSQINDVNLVGFHRHEKDFVTKPADEAAIADPPPPIDFGQLKQGSLRHEKVSQEIKIDDRFKDLEYFLGRAMIDIQPNGNIVIGDPLGAHIKLAGGDLTLSGPRIFIQSGENINLWAGRDCNVRAKGSLDFSTTEHDIRLRAYKNMQLLAQTGGALLESQAESPRQNFEEPGEDVQSSGVLLRSRGGPVAAWAGQIYLRTGSEDGSIQKGPIVLDAAKGQADITTTSRTFQRFAQNGQGYIDAFRNGENVVSSNAFTGLSSILQGALKIGGNTEIGGPLMVEGGIAVVGGHIATEQAENSNYLVAPLKDDDLKQAQSQIREIGKKVKEFVDKVQKLYQTEFKNQLYQGPEGLGSDELIKAATFSFRTAEQYGSMNFRLPEAHFQQMLRTGEATGGASWEERPVRWNNQNLYPFPGREAFEGETLLVYEHKLYDPAKQQPKTRPYEDATLAEWTKKSLKSDYQVIAR